MKKPVVVYIALGTNLGDRLSNLQHALDFMGEKIAISICSSIYETPPWGVLEQPRFLNQVIRGSTFLTPTRLLDFLKSIEARMGRVETIRFGPRVIDLDILLYGRRRVSTNRLQIPHPRMHERSFVLVPLNEIAPGLLIPGVEQTVKQLLQVLDLTGILPCCEPG